MLTKLLQKLAFLRLVCMVLAASASAMTPSNATSLNAAPAGIDLVEYALPDGTLPVICFGTGAPADENSGHCDLCLVPLVSVLKSQTDAPLLQLEPSREASDILRRSPDRGLSLWTSHPNRAPPTV